MISDALPRITVGRQYSSSKQARVRYGVAPQPTGSSTQGLPALFACNHRMIHDACYIRRHSVEQALASSHGSARARC